MHRGADWNDGGVEYEFRMVAVVAVLTDEEEGAWHFLEEPREILRRHDRTRMRDDARTADDTLGRSEHRFNAGRVIERDRHETRACT